MTLCIDDAVEREHAATRRAFGDELRVEASLRVGVDAGVCGAREGERSLIRIARHVELVDRDLHDAARAEVECERGVLARHARVVAEHESRGAADEDQAYATRDAIVWMRDGRRLDWPVGMAAALVLVESMFILALLDAMPVKLLCLWKWKIVKEV